MYICVCNAVTDSDIRTAVDDGVRNLNQLARATGCGNNCGSCKQAATEELEKALSKRQSANQMLPIFQLA